MFVLLLSLVGDISKTNALVIPIIYAALMTSISTVC